MGDYTTMNPGSGGDHIATDNINGIKHQRVKVQYGSDGSATDVSDSTPLPTTGGSAAGTQRDIFSHQIDTVGDGSGTFNANGDYENASEIFRLAPGPGEIFRISRMIVGIGDTSGMTAPEYGNIGGALVSGVNVRVYRPGSTNINLTGDVPVTTNALWGVHCYDVDLKTWGQGDELLVVRWTFTKAGQYIRLDGDAGDQFQVILCDDLTGLTQHYFTVQGYIE